MDEISHFVEVGCVQRSCFHGLFPHFDRIQIIEAHPLHVAALRWQYRPHSDHRGTSAPRGCSEVAISPRQKVQIHEATFDKFDDGSIDMIDIDVEGCEWYVLMHMRSRPRLIYIEMITTGTCKGWYTNPFFAEIEAWMKNNGYELADVQNANHIYRRIKDDQPEKDHQLSA